MRNTLTRFCGKRNLKLLYNLTSCTTSGHLVFALDFLNITKRTVPNVGNDNLILSLVKLSC